MSFANRCAISNCLFYSKSIPNNNDPAYNSASFLYKRLIRLITYYSEIDLVFNLEYAMISDIYIKKYKFYQDESSSKYLFSMNKSSMLMFYYYKYSLIIFSKLNSFVKIF